MAILEAKISNKFREEKGLGNVNISSDVFKLVLLSPGFVFDPEVHSAYSGEIISYEISSAGGYPVGGYALSTYTDWTSYSGENYSSIIWDSVRVEASGEAMEEFRSAVFYDDSHSEDITLGCVLNDRNVTLNAGDFFYFVKSIFKSI